MLEPVQDFKLLKPADRAFDACQTPYCYVTWINSIGNRQWQICTREVNKRR
jgi:hypothetical protein